MSFDDQPVPTGPRPELRPPAVPDLPAPAGTRTGPPGRERRHRGRPEGAHAHAAGPAGGGAPVAGDRATPRMTGGLPCPPVPGRNGAPAVPVRTRRGGRSNAGMKTPMPTHAFDTLPEGMFHAAAGNLRRPSAMARPDAAGAARGGLGAAPQPRVTHAMSRDARAARQTERAEARA